MKRKNKENTKLEILSPQGYESGNKPRKMTMKAGKTACDRCGACCTAGGPVLLLEDMPLFKSGVLSPGVVYTLREGEPVRSHVDGEVYESFIELMKVREKEGGGACGFYNPQEGCYIYKDRPSQCRSYRCWAPGDVLADGLEESRLTRRKLFAPAEMLIEAMDRHDEKCPYAGLAEALEKLGQGDETVVEDVMDMLQYDTYARPFLHEKLGVPEDAMDLVLGSPLIGKIREFGFQVLQDGDEYIVMPIETKDDGQGLSET